ncbi:hypothetical protein D3C87_2095780 [compost metagenome]
MVVLSIGVLKTAPVDIGFPDKPALSNHLNTALATELVAVNVVEEPSQTCCVPLIVISLAVA